MTTMAAIRIHEYGGPEVLKYEDAPPPNPLDAEAVVRVHGAGVNPLDAKIRAGLLRQAIPYQLPFIPGWDVSGTIEWLGPAVRGWEVGDEVYTRPDVRRNGGYAEFIAIPAPELARKPRSIDHLHAAAVPLCGLTAWQALFDASNINLTAGQTVLIHGAAGGVGHFAVQLAKWRGAKVIATGSTRNEGFLRELGADVFVDYTKTRFEEATGVVDAVLDTVGGDTQGRSWPLVRRGGVLVTTVSPPSPDEAQRRGVRAAVVAVETRVADLDQLTRLIDERRVRPAVSGIFQLAQARRAHEQLEGGHIRGKLVIDVAG